MSKLTCLISKESLIEGSNLLPHICESLKNMYQATYGACTKGKDKYMRFQLQWYRQCSQMLLEKSVQSDNTYCLSDATSKWFDFKNSWQTQCPTIHSNAVLIAVQGAVFDHLATRVVSEIPCTTTAKGTTTELSVSLEVLPFPVCCTSAIATFTHAHSTREASLSVR